MDWTFYCNLQRPGLLDEEARSLGARVIHTPVPIGNKFQFVRALRQELWRGRYDVLHCHHDLVSAVYLMAALGVPIDKRIVHVHNADESVLTPNIAKQWLLPPMLRNICLATADRIVGISNHTLDTFLAGRPRRAGRDVVHYYGVDQAPFEPPRGTDSLFVASLACRMMLGFCCLPGAWCLKKIRSLQLKFSPRCASSTTGSWDSSLVPARLMRRSERTQMDSGWAPRCANSAGGTIFRKSCHAATGSFFRAQNTHRKGLDWRLWKRNSRAYGCCYRQAFPMIRCCLEHAFDGLRFSKGRGLGPKLRWT